MKRKPFLMAGALALVGSLMFGLAACGSPGAESSDPASSDSGGSSADAIIAEGTGHTQHGYELDVLLQEYESGKVNLYLAFHGGGQGGGQYIEYTGIVEKGVDEDGDGLVLLTIDEAPTNMSNEQIRETMNYSYGVQSTNTYNTETGAYTIPVQFSMFGYADMTASIDVAATSNPTDVETWYAQYGLPDSGNEPGGEQGNEPDSEQGDVTATFFGGGDDFSEQGGTAAQVILNNDHTATAKIGYASAAGDFYASYLDESGTWDYTDGQYVIAFATKIVDGEEIAIDETFTTTNDGAVFSFTFTATKYSSEKQQDESYEIVVSFAQDNADGPGAAMLTIAGTYTSIELYADNSYQFEFPGMISETGTWSWDSAAFVLTLTTESGQEYVSEINSETYALEFTYTADAGGGQLSDSFSTPREDWGPVLNPA